MLHRCVSGGVPLPAYLDGRPRAHLRCPKLAAGCLLPTLTLSARPEQLYRVRPLLRLQPFPAPGRQQREGAQQAAAAQAAAEPQGMASTSARPAVTDGAVGGEAAAGGPRSGEPSPSAPYRAKYAGLDDKVQAASISRGISLSQVGPLDGLLVLAQVTKSMQAASSARAPQPQSSGLPVHGGVGWAAACSTVSWAWPDQQASHEGPEAKVQAASTSTGSGRVWCLRCCSGCNYLQWLFQLAAMEHLGCTQTLPCFGT